ncbi:MAG TPA: ornithine cyclodeaminase family protein [Solirubrobacteraceae bacterium]|nr:ornithine cyclodeaminase family protein [Solirubrobacteraceae bacterium]
MSSVLILGHDDVITALPPEVCADAMAEVLAAHARGEAKMPLRSMVPFNGAAGFMGLMPAWRGGEEPVFSLKSLCVMPGNPARGLDAHQGTVTLFDGATGVPTAILDASAITAVRTAAVSAVATRTLAREDACVLAILGAGVQGRAHLRALLPVREFADLRVYSPTQAHAQAIVAGGDGRARVVSSAEDAVRGADVVVTATSAREPVLRRAWLEPGAHVNAVGASMPSVRELDVDTVAACALFCDSRESLRNEAGEYRLALEQGAIPGENHVRGELGEVLAGSAPGRLHADELTVFRSLGLAVEDLAAAGCAVARARELGIGTEVEL